MYIAVSELVIFIFFRQKSAYEMRIRDWSSDVCSSDIDDDLAGGQARGARSRRPQAARGGRARRRHPDRPGGSVSQPVIRRLRADAPVLFSQIGRVHV